MTAYFDFFLPATLILHLQGVRDVCVLFINIIMMDVFVVDFLPFGKEVEIGFRLRVVEGESDTLFEVIQKHKLQADWKPGIETASLYKIVEDEHAGTLDDPIPYVQGMAFEKDKYYKQYGVIYLCILTTVTGYPNDLKDLPTIVQEVKQ